MPASVWYASEAGIVVEEEKDGDNDDDVGARRGCCDTRDGRDKLYVKKRAGAGVSTHRQTGHCDLKSSVFCISDCLAGRLAGWRMARDLSLPEDLQ